MARTTQFVLQQIIPRIYDCRCNSIDNNENVTLTRNILMQFNDSSKHILSIVYSLEYTAHTAFNHL